MMGGKKNLIKEVIDVFLTQVIEELQVINDALEKSNFEVMRRFAHTMKSTVSIMGISALAPVLKEMEVLTTSPGPDSNREEELKELTYKLNSICEQAVEEIKREMHNYV